MGATRLHTATGGPGLLIFGPVRHLLDVIAGTRSIYIEEEISILWPFALGDDLRQSYDWAL